MKAKAPIGGAEEETARDESLSVREIAALSVRETAALGDRLRRQMLRTVSEYGLIEEGDRILVAVSGGKDSYTLLELLEAARRRSPVNYELVAFHLDQGQPGYDGGPLAAWMEAFGVPFEIHSEDTYSVVLEQVAKRPTSYCAPCSRFRRGIIYTHAERLGCNKIALGHHREDTLETLLLNLFYAGKIQAMPPRYRTQDGRFEVIRPLIEMAEAEIVSFASARAYPILPCNLCGTQDGLKRESVRRLLERLEGTVPELRQVMLGALKHVRPTHLFDQSLWPTASDEA